MFYKIIIGLAIVSLISVSSVIAGTEDDTDGKSRYLPKRRLTTY